MKKPLFFAIISLILASIATAAQQYSYTDLINQLTDLERLVEKFTTKGTGTPR